MSMFSINNPEEIKNIYDDIKKFSDNNKLTIFSSDKMMSNLKIYNTEENSMHGGRFFFPFDNNNSADYASVAYSAGALPYLIKMGAFKKDTNGNYVNIYNISLLQKHNEEMGLSPHFPFVDPNTNYFINVDPSPPGPNPSPNRPGSCPVCKECPSQNGCKECKECPVCPSQNGCKECKESGITQAKMLLYSLIAAILFILLSNAYSYRITNYISNKLIPGKDIDTQQYSGVPTISGYILHFVLYFLIIYGIMNIFHHFSK